MMRTSCFSKIIPKIHLPPISTNPIPFSKPSKNHEKQESPDAPCSRRIQGAYRGGVVRTRMWAQARSPKSHPPLGGFFHSKGPWGPQKELQRSGDPGGHHGVASGVQNLRPEVLGEIITCEILLEDFDPSVFQKKHNSFFCQRVRGRPK